MKKKRKVIIFIVIIISIIFLYNYSKNKYSNDRGIFSWDSNLISKNRYSEMYDILNDLHINKIYQNLYGLNKEEIKMFVKDINKNINAEVYYLTGSADWYDNYNKIIKNIEFICKYNEEVENKFKVKGIVLDIEPWVLDKEWDKEIYKDTLIKVYEYSKNNNLELINVIPFWLEEDLIDSIVVNSDEIAVMNYNIKNPIKNIEEEVNKAKEYKKKINIIAEVQPQNEEYGVTKDTTYYYKGYNKLIEDWNNIIKEYKYKELGFSYHDYKNIINFLNRDE